MRTGFAAVLSWASVFATPIRNAAAIIVCATISFFAGSTVWVTQAHAQVVFNETFGTTNTQLPTATSTADGNWTVFDPCLNGRIILDTNFNPTHMLHHNTATCAYTPGEAVWRNVTAIPVEPNRTYVFSYRSTRLNTVSDPILSQAVATNAGGSLTVLDTVDPGWAAPGSWVNREVVFRTGPGTTSVDLRINNANTTGSGNDFLMDDIVLEGLEADLSITKDDGETTFSRGSNVTYQIVVSNAGPESVVGASVSDPLPGGIATANWTCGSATGGAVCGAASGTGAINTTADLPAASSVTYSLTLTVPPTYPGVNLTNTATVAAPGSIPDPVAGNNTASDTNVVSPSQPSFGVCDATMYLAQNSNTRLFQFDTTSNPFAVNPVGAASGTTYNAIGFNPIDKYIYGLRGPNPPSLMRIGQDGSVVDVGKVTGLSNGSVSGEIGPDGTFYVLNSWILTKIDIPSMTATSLTLSEGVAGHDLAWHNGLLYAAAPGNGLLSAIDPVSGQVTRLGNTGVDNSGFGGMFGASNGVFGSSNDGGFYKFDLTTGSAILISNLQGSGNNDGAKCPTTALEFPVDLAITKDNGRDFYGPGDTTYEIVVTNDGPFGVQGALVNDALPTGISDAEWTCGAVTGGGVCGVASGIGAIEDAPISLPVGASVTFEMTLTVPPTFTGDLVNTATVTSPVGSSDVDPSNNSATDTDGGQPSFGMCDATLYLAQNQPTGLFEFNTSSNPFSVNPVGPTSSIQYNAIAMHPTDGYIYGLQGPAPGRVVRVGSDGSVTDLGTVAGLPINSVSGEIGPDGTYYVANSTTLYRINLETMSATSVGLSQSVATLDMAWHNGLLYTAVDGAGLFAINPINGGVTAIGSTGVAGNFGGMFGATNGVFGSNNAGGFYRFNLTTGRGTLISDLQGSSSNDGAKCVTTPLGFPADTLITKDDGSELYTPGTEVVYTIVVSNDGPFGVQDALVNDQLPDGITEAAWVCGAPVNGGVCGVASGTGAIVDAPVNLPVDGSVTFTMTMSVPEDFTGELVNTATIGNPSDVPDPDTSNNTATDTNGPAEPALEIEKTGTLNDLNGNDLIDPGETITYSFLVTNTGNVTLTDVTVNDPLLSGAGIDVEPEPQTLEPGGSVTFEATYQPTQNDIDSGSVTNTATGTGTPPGTPPIESPPDEVTVPPNPQPGLTIEKTGTLNDLNGNDLIDPGETITYSFLVTNNGAVTLTDVTVNDPLLSDAGISVSPGPQTLAPGGSATFEATYEPTQAEIDSGSVVNTATGTGTPPEGPPTESPPDDVTIPPNREPSLTIDKTGQLNDLNGNNLIDPGETITYSFLVRNTGAVTLTDVTVDDPLLADAGISVTPAPQTLAPGGSVTFRATYQPTQADIDSGSVTNTAIGTGTPPDGPPTESPPDEVTVPPNPESGLTIEKTGQLNDLNGNDLIDPGETITYSFLVTNTGAVTLTDVTVDDPMLADAGISVTPEPQTLAPGGSATFTATYEPTQADIDSGSVTNTATGTGTPPDGPPTESPPDEVTVPPNPEPGLVIEKTGTLNDLNGNDLIDSGETITYSFLVTNNGAVTLTDVTVDDPMLADAGISVSPGPQTLAPGESATFTATYEPTQADIDSGSVTNTATGTGTPPDGPPTESPPDEVTVPPNPEPGLTIEKTGRLNDLNGNALIDAGETITYSFLVTNTGAVTLSDVTVDDPMLADAGIAVSPGPQTLAPGGSANFTATYEPTQADIDSGSVTNTATGTGTPPDGPPVESPPDEVTVPPNPEAGLTIEKTGQLNDLNGNDLIDPGETITYSFLVTNTGAVTLTDVTVDDPMLADAGISVSPAPQTLTPGGRVTFTATYQPTQADIDSGSVTNTATGTGTPPDGPPVESPPDEVTVPPSPESGLVIEKTGTLNDANGNELIDLGETITYSFQVTNNGAVTLTDVTVDDPMLAGAGISISPGPQTLAPGETVTFTATYEPTQSDIDAGSVTNVATGTGTPPEGPPVESPPDEVTVPPDETPGMSIEKTGTLNDLNGNDLIDAGETITYSFLVTNTGAVTLTDVTVYDPMLADAGISVSPGPQTLAPGGSVTFTATYQPTQADIDAGSVTNTATGTGTPPDGPPVESPPDDATVPPNPEPDLLIEKTGELNDLDDNELLDPGETITYAFLVTNNGAVTLTDVTVNDPLLVEAGISVTPEPQTLAPGESATFTAVYTPTDAEIEAGSVTNTATGIGTPPDGPPFESPPDTVTVPEGRPGIGIVKTGEYVDTDGNGQANAGDELHYTFVVTNTGNILLSDVVPQDEGPSFNGIRGTGSLSPFTPASADLRPREEQTYTAIYVLTQTDIDNGAGVEDGVENTASAVGYANGDEITGRPVESDESVVVIALPAPETDVSIIKIADLRYIRRGEQAPFTIRVTNNGAMRLDGFTVTDTLPSGFRYVDGSATVDGVEVTPVVSGRQVVFENLTVEADSEMVIRLRMLALSSAGAGKHTNRATIRDRSGNPIAPDTDAVVEILVEPIFDCGDIIGKVFDDVNRNGYQDDGEPGMPGVRIATAKGWLVTTDQYGRFHVPCAALPDNRIGSNFIMKLDERTLPTGYRLTTENPRVVRLTAGKMTKLNFGVSIGRVVRLDLKGEAFEADGTDLKVQWAEGVDQLIALLRQEQSVLRLSYIDAGTDERLAQDRIEGTKQLIMERWRESGGQYRLEIETRLEVGQ
ncbi:DUF7507 domain-containing protein [Neoaquamicrobium sediminum]|uniref:DUF7507 domain-containing protein n=1 Tax=Neoaquamicrobium sediminum TaxID=1849104 RepID=UPI004036F961